MTFDEIKNLDTQNLGTWPTGMYLIVTGIVFLVICGLGYQFIIADQLKQFERIQKKEPQLKQTYRIKHIQTANLEAYKTQLDEMRQRFGSMLQQLPSENEVPALLKEVSQARQAANLEEHLFEPKAEVPKEFYAELPITLQLSGRYHNYGKFVATLAALSRIVTLTDIKLTVSNKQSNDNDKADHSELTLQATAKTYRYIEQKEKDAKSAK